MIKNKLSLLATSGFVMLMTSGVAHATGPAAAQNNFSTLSQNVIDSVASVPGLLTAVCYVFGIILVILGIIKIKEHVEKPDQTPIKEGFIRLCIGGALFALPLLLEVAKNTVQGGDTAQAVSAGTMKKVIMSVN